MSDFDESSINQNNLNNLNHIRERSERERKAKEKWVSNFNEIQTQLSLQQEAAKKKQDEIKAKREESALLVQKNWNKYKITDEYKKGRQEYKKTQEEKQKIENLIDQEGIDRINQYRIQYGMDPSVPIWKVWSKMLRTKGYKLDRKLFPHWAGFQLTIGNQVTLEEIKGKGGTKCIRLYGSQCKCTGKRNAMYLFGQRLDICYEGINTPIEDVVWAYANSPEGGRNYVDFYYHTEISEPVLYFQGFLLGCRQEEISLDGLKIVPDKSLVKSGEIFYKEKFLDKEEADEMFDLLYDMDKFRFTKMYHYNQETKQIDVRNNHRQSYWLGDHAQATGYTDQVVIDRDTGDKVTVPTDFVTPYEFPPLVWELKERIEQAYGIEFNGCLVGLYDGPAQKIGYHSDSSQSMGEDPYIGSVSFGASRKFSLKPNRETSAITDEKPIQVVLKHGDLVVMRRNANKNYLHAVMKDPNCNPDNVRINLTFRLYDYHPDEKKFEAQPF